MDLGEGYRAVYRPYGAGKDAPEFSHRGSLEVIAHPGAGHPAGVQTLHEATGGDPSRSRIYREIMRPMGIEQEAVVALRTASGENWGAEPGPRDGPGWVRAR